jgi:hypothetical protein
MVLAGWEGSTSDSTLWLEGRRIGALPIPEGKYLPGDAGFANCDTCLTPYRGVRYRLKEWAKGKGHRTKRNFSTYVTRSYEMWLNG